MNLSKARINKQSGFSIGGYIISLAVVSLIFSACLSGVRSLIKNSNYVNKYLNDNERILHVAGLLRLMTREIDYHRYPIPPKVFRAGVITRADGTRLNIEANPHSDAIGALSFKGEDAFVIQNFVNNKAYGCFRTDSNSRIHTDFLIGISPDGERLFRANKEIGGKRCDEIVLSPTTSLLLAEVNIKPETVKIIYPVDKEYLLYISKNHELKIISFKGDEIRENQPIETNINNLSLKLDTLLNGKLYVLSASITGNYQTISFPFCHALTRVSSLQHILNL